MTEADALLRRCCGLARATARLPGLARSAAAPSVGTWRAELAHALALEATPQTEKETARARARVRLAWALLKRPMPSSAMHSLGEPRWPLSYRAG